MRRLSTIALAWALACGDSRSDPELEADQGACDALAEAACRLDARCQQAYVDSGHQASPTPLRCLLVESPTIGTRACTALSKDDCRTRNDCAPVYWQELGPDDGPVGDPYYQRCDPELSP